MVMGGWADGRLKSRDMCVVSREGQFLLVFGIRGLMKGDVELQLYLGSVWFQNAM